VSDDAPAVRLAATIIDVVRTITRTTPAPRGAPFFYMDSDVWYDLDVLGSFCAHGIFRKYEFAIDLGCGFGGRARWLAARSGCRVLAVDPRLDVVQGATLLNRRGHATAQVAFRAGHLDALPLRARVFTHAWMVVTAHNPWRREILAEAFRVLRPGAGFALQTVGGPSGATALPDALASVGFVQVEQRAVTLTELPLSCRAAHDRVRALWRDAAYDELLEKATGERRGLQVFARRPA